MRIRPSTAAHYRWAVLENVDIFIPGKHLLPETEIQVNAILQRIIPEERKTELQNIAQQFQNSFIDTLDRASREDDCVEPIIHAITLMGYQESLVFGRKAGTYILLLKLVSLINLRTY